MLVKTFIKNNFLKMETKFPESEEVMIFINKEFIFDARIEYKVLRTSMNYAGLNNFNQINNLNYLTISFYVNLSAYIQFFVSNQLPDLDYNGDSIAVLNLNDYESLELKMENVYVQIIGDKLYENKISKFEVKDKLTNINSIIDSIYQSEYI